MYLGIDLGTSGLKLLILDAEHRVHATADAPLTLQRPQPLWAEQHPQDWWDALETAVQALRAQAPQAWRHIRAMGLSGQMHGAVTLDSADQVIRPAILWNDGRSAEQCAVLESQVPSSRQITGNLAMPGFTAPKLLWMQTHERALFERVRQVLLPKDWLRLQLTGERATDMSDASGTLWLDVGQRCWSPVMLQACGLDLSHMPRLLEGSAVSGHLRPALAQRWGLSHNVSVAAGGGDNAASAVGIGAVLAGQGFVSLGTSGVVFLAGYAFTPAPEQAVHAFAHALPGRWHQMSVMLSAASALGWLARLIPGQSEADLAHMAALLSPTQQATAPIFLPYLSGERTPHNNPLATGCFAGLRSEHGAADLAYAVLEGVAFGLKDGLNAMLNAQVGSAAPRLKRPDQLTLVGGGAQSSFWAQLVADCLGVGLLRPHSASAAAALGAARLAWLSTGAPEPQVCRPSVEGDRFDPSHPASVALTERYGRFRALYPALEGDRT